MKKFLVEELYEAMAKPLDLQLVAGEGGLRRRIHHSGMHRPGLCLAGYLKNYDPKRILVFGRVELGYLRDLEEERLEERLAPILTSQTPAVFISRRFRPPSAMVELCQQRRIPLFRSPEVTIQLINRVSAFLNDQFAPTISCHGCLVEVFGVGMLIQGESAVGKSEAALGLIERGHRLISDDIVKICKREGGYLEGFGVELSRHHMEVRGIGIINVAHLYGAVCVRERKSLDLVVQLEEWDDDHFYDRVGLEERTIDFLEVEVPHHLLPVKPGRDVVLLLETISLNHRLKKMGYHSAREFNQKLLAAIAAKTPA